MEKREFFCTGKHDVFVDCKKVGHTNFLNKTKKAAQKNPKPSKSY